MIRVDLEKKNFNNKLLSYDLFPMNILPLCLNTHIPSSNYKRHVKNYVWVSVEYSKPNFFKIIVELKMVTSQFII
jgi:hypothetical protein